MLLNEKFIINIFWDRLSKIFLTRRTIKFFTFSLIFLILLTFSFTLPITLWITKCWWNFEIFNMVMIWIFLLKIYRWTHTIKTFTWKFQKNTRTCTITFWNFSYFHYIMVMIKFFGGKICIWNNCENMKKFYWKIFAYVSEFFMYM